MLSYTGRRQSFQDLTNASDISTLAVGDRLMNQSEKRILGSRDWPFLERIDTTQVTTGGTQAYNINALSGKFKSVYVAVSNVRYVPREITNREDWDRLNVLSYNADFPVWFYVFNGQVNLWPTPASSNNTIGLIYKKLSKDLTIGDYTTGTIFSIANGGTAVVGSGSSWTAKMANRFIRITESDTANTGDGYWYEISALPSATTLTLLKPYQGIAISAATASYTIGQMSLFPEGYTDIPVFDAVRQYFSTIQPDVAQAKFYGEMYEELLKQMIEEQGDKTSSPVLSYGIDEPKLINPNLTISL